MLDIYKGFETALTMYVNYPFLVIMTCIGIAVTISGINKFKFGSIRVIKFWWVVFFSVLASIPICEMEWFGATGEQLAFTIMVGSASFEGLSFPIMKFLKIEKRFSYEK